MVISAHSPLAAKQESGSPANVKTALQHLTGMLWNEMLSALNETGMDASTLGPGGGNFQSMFLWNISQNDFGKYDTHLINSALRQIGGQGGEVPALPQAATAIALAAKNNAPIDAEPLPALSQDASPPPDFVTQAVNFAKSIWPQIIAAAQALGVPPVAVLAQTALETGWGASAPGNNLFGMKAANGEASTVRATHEMQDGVLTPQLASFRDYNDSSSSISDYVGLIQSSYQNATGQSSVSAFAQALQSGGYATDQNYAAKITKIAQSPVMAQVLQAVGAPPAGKDILP